MHKNSIALNYLLTVVLVVTFMVNPKITRAQNDKPSLPDSSMLQSLAHSIPIQLGYYGNLGVHPGFKIGAEWNVYAIQKNKFKKRKNKYKAIRKILYAQPNLSFYYHKRSHSAWQFAIDLGWRRYRPKLFYTDVAFGLGYMRRFNLGETYIADNEGNITETKKGTSRGYFVPNLSFAIGKHIPLKEQQGISIFTRLNGYAMVNYNSGIVPDASFEIGVKFYSNLLTNNSVKTRIK